MEDKHKVTGVLDHTYIIKKYVSPDQRSYTTDGSHNCRSVLNMNVA